MYNLHKIFQEWYEFSGEEYKLMEKQLRKLDGKKRLIKNERKGLFMKALVTKWKVDTDDEIFKVYEQSVRKGLDYYLFKDEKMLDYIEKNGVVVASTLLYYWTQYHLKQVIKEAFYILKEKSR